MEENVIQISGGITTNVDVNIKASYVCRKYIYIWNDKYLANITDNSVISCDEIIEEKTKMVTVNINEKMQSVKLQKKNFYILFAFLLITILLLIVVSIYCYLIKYKAKHYVPNKFKKVLH